MTVPLEISYRDVLKTDSIDELIRQKAEKLERMHPNIQSCRVAIEKPHTSVKTGNAFRVRLDITVPPGHVIAVNKEPGKNDMHTPLPAVIREAFGAAEKQLKKLNEIQKGNVKRHVEDDIARSAIVADTSSIAADADIMDEAADTPIDTLSDNPAGTSRDTFSDNSVDINSVDNDEMKRTGTDS